MSLSNIDYSVLQVLPHLDSGGLVNGAVEISRTLSNNNLGSYITTSGGRRLHEVTRFGTEVIIAPVQSKNPVTIYRNISKIKKIIKNNNNLYQLKMILDQYFPKKKEKIYEN